MLQVLNEHKARAHVFFRGCTLPSESVMRLLEQGSHAVGLHLENSRSFSHFCEEKKQLERHIRAEVYAVSKHGSGTIQYGRRHYAPYDPEKYVQWACDTGMKLFLGNLQDPSLTVVETPGFRWFPSAFWLEPYWRDTQRFTVDWLLSSARETDKVLLVHPENVQEDPLLIADFGKLIASLNTKIVA